MLATMTIVSVTDARLRFVSFSLRSLVLQPFLLQQWSRLSWYYPWSISTEDEAYVFFVFSAGLLVTGKHPRLMAVCCVAILAELCIAKGGSLNLYRGISGWSRTLSEFSLGALLYRAYSNQCDSRAYGRYFSQFIRGLGEDNEPGFPFRRRVPGPHLLWRQRDAMIRSESF